MKEIATNTVVITFVVWFALLVFSGLINQKADDLMRSREQGKQISENKVRLTNEIAHVSTIAVIWGLAIIAFMLVVFGILIDIK